VRLSRLAKGAVGGSFTPDTRIVLDDAYDCPNYVGSVDNRMKCSLQYLSCATAPTLACTAGPPRAPVTGSCLFPETFNIVAAVALGSPHAHPGFPRNHPAKGVRRRSALSSKKTGVRRLLPLSVLAFPPSPQSFSGPPPPVPAPFPETPTALNPYLYIRSWDGDLTNQMRKCSILQIQTRSGDSSRGGTPCHPPARTARSLAAPA